MPSTVRICFLLSVGLLVGAGCTHQVKGVDRTLRDIVWAAGLDHSALGEYPQSLDDIRSANIEVGKDPWGRDYVYRLVDGQPVAVCYGRDGKAGGSGASSDRVWSVERLELPPEISPEERAWYVVYGTGFRPEPFRARR